MVTLAGGEGRPLGRASAPFGVRGLWLVWRRGCGTDRSGRPPACRRGRWRTPPGGPPSRPAFRITLTCRQI